MPPLHLADILSQGLPHYQQQHRLTRQQYQVCAHILACRTGQLGYQQWRCDQCGHEEQFSCSCRDRHCPRCQGQATQAWIAKQAMSLLPCPYFHLVFTLPHELNLIAHYAPNVLYHCLFKSLWQTLMTFAAHRHQGQLGMTCVLHTWGQNLSQHIHVHCLIPAGSLNRQSQWQPITKGYLYPVKALSTVFRGKMIAALKAQSIALPSLPATWCVYSKACVYPHQLLHYLARYTRKGALSESRLVNYNASRVRFRYKDYRDNNKTKFMTLSMDEFIRRYLQHVLP
ncbi:transposase, partial [Vibrio parahaemolyticus]|nr:transposase [Vibrio parahaemolyticus]